jgi:hypothetical protein
MAISKKIKYFVLAVLALIALCFISAALGRGALEEKTKVSLSCQGFFSAKELEYLSKDQSYKVYPEPRLSLWQASPGEKVEICYPHLFLQALSRGIPFKIQIYRNGFLIQEKKVSPTNLEKNLVSHDILPDGQQHDYIIQVLNLTGKPLVTSHPKILLPQSSDRQENQVEIEWVLESSSKGSPQLTPATKNTFHFDSELTDYVLSKGFEKLIYAVKKNPFASKGEINKVVLTVGEKTMEIKNLKIYGASFGGETSGPISTELENPYVLVKYDAAFSSNSFIWDDALATWFSLDLDPRIAKNTLDFWYSLQIKQGKNKGFIPREIRARYYHLLNTNEANLERNINPLSFHPLNSNQVAGPFVLSRVELELFYKTNDAERLKKVLPSLISYFEWVEKNRKNTKFVQRIKKTCPTYWTSNLGSGMDNSPRGGGNENFFDFEKYSWFDLIAQQAALAKDISQIAKIIENEEIESEFSSKYLDLKNAINQCYWDPEKSAWFDLKPNGDLDKESQTIAFMWGLYASLADENELKALLENWIKNSKKFGRYPPLPTLSRDHKLFNEEGDYWKGGCWPPTWWHTLKGLGENEALQSAHELALQIFQAMNEVYKKEGSVFEFYAPTPDSEGKAKVGIWDGNNKARSEFLGWAKLPWALASEFIFGFQSSVKALIWNFYPPFSRMKISSFAYQGNKIDAEIVNYGKDWLEIKTTIDKPLSILPRLILDDFKIREGEKINLSPGTQITRINFK